MELSNLLHGFLLTGERSVEVVAVTARLVMKQAADFLDKFVNINNSQCQVVRITLTLSSDPLPW